MPGHGNARSEGAQPAESTAVMEALAAMRDRLNQSLDAFNKHLTSMDASIQHGEAVMGERLSAMALRIEELEVKKATRGPTISQKCSTSKETAAAEAHLAAATMSPRERKPRPPFPIGCE